MMRTECDTVRDVLPEYVTGTVPGTTRTNVDSHLAVCADCRANVEVMELLMRAAVTAPAGLQQRVIHSVHTRRAPAYHTYRRMAYLAAASVVALLGTRALLIRSGESAEPPAAMATSTGAQPAQLQVPPSSETPRPSAGNDLSEEQLRSLIAELES
jgi:anti-sigma factor RsiW